VTDRNRVTKSADIDNKTVLFIISDPHLNQASYCNGMSVF
jgi:hypothetical protein